MIEDNKLDKLDDKVIEKIVSDLESYHSSLRKKIYEYKSECKSFRDLLKSNISVSKKRERIRRPNIRKLELCFNNIWERLPYHMSVSWIRDIIGEYHRDFLKQRRDFMDNNKSETYLED